MNKIFRKRQMKITTKGVQQPIQNIKIEKKESFKENKRVETFLNYLSPNSIGFSSSKLALFSVS